jgi:hypothetical protein
MAGCQAGSSESLGLMFVTVSDRVLIRGSMLTVGRAVGVRVQASAYQHIPDDGTAVEQCKGTVCRDRRGRDGGRPAVRSDWVCV